MHIFKSAFEIKSSYQMKHLILHPWVRIWPQDLRWVSSLCGSKHHNVNNTKLRCSTGCSFSSGAEFHWAGICDESFGVRQAAGLAEDSSEPHQLDFLPAPHLWHLSSCKGDEGACKCPPQWDSRHPELLNPGHPGKNKCREDHRLNCLFGICQCGLLSEQTQGKVMSMSF